MCTHVFCKKKKKETSCLRQASESICRIAFTSCVLPRKEWKPLLTASFLHVLISTQHLQTPLTFHNSDVALFFFSCLVAFEISFNTFYI